jgi:hypothetical protein
MKNIRQTFGVDNFLEVASQCEMVRLQKCCVGDILMDLVDLSRAKTPGWRDLLSKQVEKLHCYELDPEVKQKLIEAMAEIIIFGASGPKGNAFHNLKRTRIEELLR